MGIEYVDLDVLHYAGLLRGKCIGFGGKLGSGKTYLADAMIDYIHHNSSVKAVRRSFADELRNFVHNKVGIPVSTYKHDFNQLREKDRMYCVNAVRDHVNENGFVLDDNFLVKRYALCTVFNDLYRTTLQLVGTELYRMQVDMDIWANSVGKTLDSDCITVIDDIRFPNELNVVKQNGISVYSMALNSDSSVSDLHVEQHASETSIGAADFEVIFYNLIGRFKTKAELGKAVFNTTVPFYFMFKVMQDEPNKEKILRQMLKNSCIYV